MNFAKFPCVEGVCAQSGDQSNNGSDICQNIGEMIIKAGGAGVFEATPCPIEALFVLAGSTSEKVDAVKQLLGISGLIEVDPDLFD
jgi:hypothetical protein